VRVLLLFLVGIFTSLSAVPNFVLLGPPGSGKGTFSSYMVQKFGYSQICPGDLVREQIKKQTTLGKEIEPIVRRGDYISDRIIFRMIKNRILDALEKKKPFIIDGFPRSVKALTFLNSLFAEKHLESKVTYIHLKTEDEVCVDRIANRLVCFTCKSSFNETIQKPKKHMVCDSCNGKLERRIGDSKQNAKKRLLYYRENIEPLLKIVASSFKIVEIEADKPLIELQPKLDKMCLQSNGATENKKKENN
jgi:adenylate kinase